MTTDFNPNNPATSGIEWFPARASGIGLSGDAGIGAKQLSTAAESIASIHAYLEVIGTPRQTCLDVYDLDASDPWADTQSWVEALPVANAAISGGWVKSVSTTITPIDANAYQNIDEVVTPSTALSTVTNDRIRYTATGLAGAARFYAGNTNFYDGDSGASLGSGALTGKRIVTVEVVAVVENTSAHTVRIEGQVNIGGAIYASPSQDISYVSPHFQRVRLKFPINPATGMPWTNADAIALTDGTNSFGINVAKKDGFGHFHVGSLLLQFRVVTERRVTAGFVLAGTGRNWQNIPLLDPDTMDPGTPTNWAKANATNYLYVYSTPGDTGGLAVMYGVDDSSVPGTGLTGWQGAQVTTDRLVPTAAPILTQWVPAMFFTTAAAALGADRQPYPISQTQPVYTGVGNVRQGVAPHATAAYGSATILLSRPAQTPTAALTVRCFTNANVQTGGDITIQPEDVEYNGAGLALIKAQFASNASLASGTGYYLAFTSATPATAAWQVCYAETDSVASTDGTAVAAGTISGSATLAGTANARADLLVNMQTAPTAPGSFTATVAHVTQSPAAPGGPVNISYAHLDWANTSLTSTFAYYEVQRQDFGVWNTIALITDESKSFFNDFECRRNVLTTYRLRVVRADGAVSDWS